MEVNPYADLSYCATERPFVKCNFKKKKRKKKCGQPWLLVSVMFNKDVLYMYTCKMALISVNTFSKMQNYFLPFSY
jgi:hypothetical protein